MDAEPIFEDRAAAGRALAERLERFGGRPDVVVFGLPRGGVAVAREVAQALRLPLDVAIVRKLGVPGLEELALGAIGPGGIAVYNHDVIETLRLTGDQIADIVARERDELVRRELRYRGDRSFPDVRGKTVILVDDGLATGATMLAAIAALRVRAPARIVAAIPVAAPETCELVRRSADEVVCCATPEPFGGVGAWYDDFRQLDDDAVRSLLDRD
jgi:putative phosphoribosyl transferase